MARKYNLGSKSDMRRLERDLTRAVEKSVTDGLHSMKYDINCPHCGATFQAPAGKSHCPVCKNIVDLELNIDFN